MPGAATRLTVGITTRNRAASLRRCVESLRHIEHLAPEILVFDDASEVPALQVLGPHPRLRIIRDDRGLGNIVGRNVLVAAATGDVVLLLDDDAALLDCVGIEQAIDVLQTDCQVGAVAFAQASADGSAWPDTMQPGRGQSPRYVAAFIGFAHLLNRSVFLE